MGTKQTSIYMDEGLYDRFKQNAKEQDRSVNWLFNQAIEFYLNDDKYSKLVHKIGHLTDVLEDKNKIVKKITQTEIQKQENKAVKHVKDALKKFKHSEPGRAELVAQENAKLLAQAGSKLSAKELMEKAKEDVD